MMKGSVEGLPLLSKNLRNPFERRRLNQGSPQCTQREQKSTEKKSKISIFYGTYIQEKFLPVEKLLRSMADRDVSRIIIDCLWSGRSSGEGQGGGSEDSGELECVRGGREFHFCVGYVPTGVLTRPEKFKQFVGFMSFSLVLVDVSNLKFQVSGFSDS